MNNTVHNRQFPLEIIKIDDKFIVITNHGTHYATTHDPAAARLIAATPDLLEILQAAIARIQIANQEGDCILSAWLPDAISAIAKAKGGK